MCTHSNTERTRAALGKMSVRDVSFSVHMIKRDSITFTTHTHTPMGIHTQTRTHRHTHTPLLKKEVKSSQLN